MCEQIPDLGNSTLTAASLFLDRHLGLPFCAQCLAHEAGIPPEQAREAMRKLPPPRFVREWRLCARCMREQDVVYAIPSR